MNNQQLLSRELPRSVSSRAFSSLRLLDEEAKRKNAVEEKKRNAKLKLDSFYCLLLKLAINEQIAKFGRWDALADSGGGKLDNAIANKYSIQFKSRDMTPYHDHVKLEFELIGDIEAVLEQFSMYTKVVALLPNKSGEDKLDIANLKLADNDLWNSTSIYSIEEFEDIYSQITKPYRWLLSDHQRYQA